MIKQDWMVIVAGHDLIDAMEIEQRATCRWTGQGYSSDDLAVLHRKESDTPVCVAPTRPYRRIINPPG